MVNSHSKYRLDSGRYCTARHAKDEMNAERLDNPDLNDNNTVTQMHKKHKKRKKHS